MKTILASSYALSIGVAAALLAGCGTSKLPATISPSGATPFAFTHHMTFQYTGKMQTFKVPSGVTRIQVIAVGANGGGKVTARGGRVSAVIPVAQSETLAIYVGGTGTSSGGGFNGGGAGGPTYGTNGFGAGGASDVREGGNALEDRVVVAGGGGGQGSGASSLCKHLCGFGGQGGARIGRSGKAACCKATRHRFRTGGDGGTGGTQDQGGLGGKGAYKKPGESGQLGYGGGGGSGCDGSSSSCGYSGGGGGGGGGGFYGGGGGGGGSFFGCCGAGGGGGGGGGSSYVEPSAQNVHFWQGWKNATGNGLVVFSW